VRELNAIIEEKNMLFPIPVVALDATGSVGQRFVQLLAAHPWFRLAAVTGSDRTVGQPYGETCHWVLAEPMPESVRSLTILNLAWIVGPVLG
jgi:aspartate-semialdehyde dehydrogenase